MRTSAVASLALVVCAACGGSGIDPLDGGDGEGGTKIDAAADVTALPDGTLPDAAVDAGPYGAPSTTYPAFTPWMGQLSKNGGPMLTAPVVVTITWDVDTGRATFEGFGDGLGASAYWSAAVGEYGVGPATSGSANHVHLSSQPPAQWSDSDVQTFIQQNAGSVLPAPTSQTIYVFYIAPGTTFLFNGQDACNSIGGYHDDVAVNSANVAYAVLPNCASDSQTTSAASHEIGEAATDPFPSAQPALYGFDDPYLAFDFWQRSNDENGDACEFFQDSYFVSSQPFAYAVQRLWSNKMGPLGHSPCQPYTATYFNVAPLDLQDVTVDLSQVGGPASFKTKGYLCPVGQSIQIPVGIYSDGGTQPITVTVAESNPLVNPVTGRLSLSVDSNKTTGVNGEKTYVNVTVNQAGPLKAELLTVMTTLGNTRHYLPLIVTNP